MADTPEIRAAQLRAAGWTYTQIAAKLGLDSPRQARKCAELGFSHVPREIMGHADKAPSGVAPWVLDLGTVITVHVKTGETLTGRVVAVDPEHVGEGRYAFKVLAEPLD